MLGSSSVDALELQAIGRYELLLELGRGGMAVLYLARARGVGGFSRLFAIKQILPHLAVDPPFVDMFLNEGRIAARLSHPNLCPVFELGQDRGELFLVMEYLDGVPWDALAAVAPRGARGLALTAGVLAQACEGLHYAHTFRDVDGTSTPIVHRDVSPQNVFVSADGVCRVLDFGVSKIASDRRRTGTGLLKGKLPYMAPEQLLGELADPRADVWAVGVMLWEALTGERLFDRNTDFLTYEAIIGAPIPSVNAAGPAGAAPRYPAAIDRVIARALGRDRDTRYATARELGRDLSRAAAEVGGAATRDQIADAVGALCGDQLAARRRAIATAVARRSMPPPGAATAAGAAPSRPAQDGAPSAGEAAETISMMMRRDALVVERPRRTRWWVGALGLAAAAALVAAIAAWRAPGNDPASAAPITSDDRVAAPSAGSPPPAPPAPAASQRPAVMPLGDSRGSRDAIPHRGSSAAPSRRPGTPPGTAQPSRSAHAQTAPGPVPTDDHPASDRAPAAGWYAIDSNPYATIFIDDHNVGDTPLDRIPLSAGAHRVRAVLADGRQRTFAIDIAPDRKTSSGTLTW
jgi:hypothetical protein